MNDVQLQIIGNIVMGHYIQAAKLAVNDEDNILVAMNAAFKNGYKEALINIQEIASTEIKNRLPRRD